MGFEEQSFHKFKRMVQLTQPEEMLYPPVSEDVKSDQNLIDVFDSNYCRFVKELDLLIEAEKVHGIRAFNPYLALVYTQLISLLSADLNPGAKQNLLLPINTKDDRKTMLSIFSDV